MNKKSVITRFEVTDQVATHARHRSGAGDEQVDTPLGFRPQSCLGFRVQGLGFRVILKFMTFGIRVSGFVFGCKQSQH